MIKIKNYTMIALVIFASSNLADNRIIDRTFIPLESFGLTKKSEKNNVDEYISGTDDEYVAWRCVALMTAINYEGIKPKIKKEKDIRKFFNDAKIIGVEYAYLIFNNSNELTDKDYINKNPFNDKAQLVLKPLTQKYINLIMANYAETGNYFDSNFLWGDIDTCGSSFMGYEKVKNET